MFVFTMPEKVDRTAYYYLQKANAKVNKGSAAAYMIIRVVFAALGVISLVLAVMLCTLPGNGAGDIVRIVVMFALSAFILFYSIFYYRVRAWQGARFADRNGKGGGQEVFADDEITLTDDRMSSSLGYDAVQRIFFKDGWYLLFVSRNQALLASVACLSEGSAEDFPAFLTAHTNLTIEKL